MIILIILIILVILIICINCINCTINFIDGGKKKQKKKKRKKKKRKKKKQKKNQKNKDYISVPSSSELIYTKFISWVYNCIDIKLESIICNIILDKNINNFDDNNSIYKYVINKLKDNNEFIFSNEYIFEGHKLLSSSTISNITIIDLYYMIAKKLMKAIMKNFGNNFLIFLI